MLRWSVLGKELGREDGEFSIFGMPGDAFDLDGYRRLEELGVTHIITMPWLLYGATPDSLDAKLDSLARFGDEIIAKQAT